MSQISSPRRSKSKYQNQELIAAWLRRFFETGTEFSSESILLDCCGQDFGDSSQPIVMIAPVQIELTIYDELLTGNRGEEARGK